jgi:hypothetical protein
MQLNRQQQQYFATELNNRLERITMSWSNDLRKWHPLALKALAFLSCTKMKIPQDQFRRLLSVEKQGINMNIVMILCNNLEERTASELGVTVEEMAEVLELNAKIAASWNALADPVQKTLLKEMEIMANKPMLASV